MLLLFFFFFLIRTLFYLPQWHMLHYTHIKHINVVTIFKVLLASQYFKGMALFVPLFLIRTLKTYRIHTFEFKFHFFPSNDGCNGESACIQRCILVEIRTLSRLAMGYSPILPLPKALPNLPIRQILFLVKQRLITHTMEWQVTDNYNSCYQ